MTNQGIRGLIVDQYASGGILRLRAIQEALTEPERLFWMSVTERWSVFPRYQSDGSTIESILDDFSLRFTVDKAINDLASKDVLLKGDNGCAIIEAAFMSDLHRIITELDN